MLEKQHDYHNDKKLSQQLNQCKKLMSRIYLAKSDIRTGFSKNEIICVFDKESDEGDLPLLIPLRDF